MKSKFIARSDSRFLYSFVETEEEAADFFFKQHRFTRTCLVQRVGEIGYKLFKNKKYTSEDR